jgi:hypothetical protein
MSKCIISIKIGEEHRGLMSVAQKAIVKAGGEFSGDESSGSFSISTAIGKIAGDYVIEDSIFTLTVTQKPLLISCKLIEKEIGKYLRVDPEVA